MLRAFAASAAGISLALLVRLFCFWLAVNLARVAAPTIEAALKSLPWLDPVYTHTALASLGAVHLHGLALGQHGLIRWSVEPGSPVIGRLVAAGVAHAAVLTLGVLLVRAGHLRRSWSIVSSGLACQVVVALGIVTSPPSVKELESTGLAFAVNALAPGLRLGGVGVSDVLGATPLVVAVLTALALLLAYAPAAVAVLLRGPRLAAIASATAVVLASSACASALAPPSAAAVVLDLPTSASVPAPRPTESTELRADRWFDEPVAQAPIRPSRVEIAVNQSGYQYLVNGERETIRGMGLNTQYASGMSPEERSQQLESDFAALQALGVNTVVGWDPAELDATLLETAERHGVGVVLPFDLDPEADYTDPSLRRSLSQQVMAWVDQYRAYPALRMWGLGNEVLHKIVHPAWVGPQDPAHEKNARAFASWLVETADAIHAADPDHPVTYRSAEDAFVGWIVDALNARGGGPRPWFVFGVNCYQDHLSDIVDAWPTMGMPGPMWVSEFAPGTMAVPDRPDGFRTMWGYIRRHPEWVLGGAVYAWTRNGPEGVDRNFGLTDDGVPVDGRSLDTLAELFHASD